nr:MAG TPA: hypothetical protein [Caudoviricetes sp.]
MNPCSVKFSTPPYSYIGVPIYEFSRLASR